MKIYLNYNPNDAGHAAKLRTLLKDDGFDVWDANYHGFLGDNWPKQFGKALREAHAMILVVSPMMLKNPFFHREIDYAIGHIQFENRFIVAFTKPVEELKGVPWILMNELIHRVVLTPGHEKKVAAKIASLLTEYAAEAVPA